VQPTTHRVASHGEVLIIGGGIIGSATAYFLAMSDIFRGSIRVLERDPTYAQAATALSASSIRQQFSTAINVRISQFGMAFLRECPRMLAVDADSPDVALVERSYLYLATAAGRADLAANVALQSSLGVAVELLERSELRRRYPWLNVDDIEVGAATRNAEGWFDAYSLLQAFRRKAKSLGVTFVRAEASDIMLGADGAFHGVRLTDGAQLNADWCVCAAGTRASSLLQPLGIDLPVRARKRCVFVFEASAEALGAPLVIDPSGLYFRPEGTGYICGLPPEPDLDVAPDDFTVDATLFEERIWPILAQRVPGFEALRCTRSWAGHYDYNLFDQNAFVGAVPKAQRLLIANGFSGHGLQQAPAVGRGLAELIAHGEYRSLDLSPLSFDRYLQGTPLAERSVI
jgi:FAD-dependent oxidoreductase domain-containing protein 1